MANCECFQKLGEDMESRVKAKLPEGATLRSAGWKQAGLFMDSGVMSVNHFIEFNATYQEIKKDGTPKARPTKQDFPVVFSFCPFCGVSTKRPVYEFPFMVAVVEEYDTLATNGSSLQLLGVGDEFATYRNTTTGEEIRFTPELLKERIGCGRYVVEVQ